MKLMIIYSLIAVTFLPKSYESRITVLEKYEVDNLPTILNNENNGVNCTGVVGSICSDRPEDCGRVFMCLSDATSIVVDCPQGQACNAGKCSTNRTRICEYKNLTFKCTTEGMYPEPTSCMKYNYCVPSNSPDTPVNPIPVTGTCPTGWSYNAYYTHCSTREETDKHCYDRVVPECKENGQSDPILSNHDSPYYYVCSPYSKEDPTLYPFISKCPENEHYYQGSCI